MPMRSCTKAAAAGSGRSGVQVATISRSTDPGDAPAASRARVPASADSVDVVSPSPTKCRAWMPVRSAIHSSDVSRKDSNHELGTSREGSAEPIPAILA